mgnify:CR=1 FL=1
MVSRRDVLRIGGVAATTGIAGCGIMQGNSGDAKLGKISINNECNEEKTLMVYIERDGEPAFTSSYSVSANSEYQPSIPNSWKTEPAEYTIVAGLEEKEPKKITLAENGCQSLIIRIDESSVVFFVPNDEDPEACKS